MLSHLKLEHVGPASVLDFEFGDRLNFLTGDNSVGKTFILDAAWWALTRTWAGAEILPSYSKEKVSRITYQIQGRTGKPTKVSSVYEYLEKMWKLPPGRPAMPGIVVYARVDGSFAIWDPARNYWRDSPIRNVDQPDRPNNYSFSQSELWDGLETVDEKGKRVLCNGLVRDLREWQLQQNETFDLFQRVLKHLSPGEPESMILAGSQRLKDDAREIPTLVFPYGKVPISLASSGVKRILGLAYLLVWTWIEHKAAADQILDPEPERRMVVLFDEVEAHLHPRWQRLIMPSLMGAAQDLRKDLNAQFIVATHSPLVLASVEPSFDSVKDKLFTLDLIERDIHVREGWAKQGDAVNWLTSDVFGLLQARSVEAEQAIEAAEAWMRDERVALPEGLETREKIDQGLRKVLADHDPFWPRWIIEGVGRERP